MMILQPAMFYSRCCWLVNVSDSYYLTIISPTIIIIGIKTLLMADGRNDAPLSQQSFVSHPLRFLGIS